MVHRHPDTSRTSIVVGGGIGGLATAHALRQQGFQVRVFERAGDLAKIQIGAGLNLWTNALWALRQLGLDQRVESAGNSLEWFEHRTASGELLSRWPVGPLGRDLGATPISVARSELIEALSEGLESDVVHLGRTCVGYEQGKHGVTARFDDGSEESADILIGADGLNSAVRAQLLGTVPPRYAGYVTWRGVTDRPPPSVPLAAGFPLHWGYGLRFGYYRIGGGQLYWFGIANGPADQSDPDGNKRAAVFDRFRTWAPPIEAIIEATSDDAVHRTAIFDRPPSNCWGEGRVTLLGDAAHAMTFNVGQGACTAIEDAVALAKCLRDNDDCVVALRAYETLRRDRTTPMVNRAWRIGQMGQWSNPLACALRAGFIRILFDRVALKAQVADMAFKV